MPVMAGSGNFGGKKAAPFGKGGKKMRPGSIGSGSGKGKFPVQTSKDAKDAAMLAGRAKGVAKAKVIAHIKAQVRKRGLKMPPSIAKKPDVKAANCRLVGNIDLSTDAEPHRGDIDLDWKAFDAARGHKPRSKALTRAQQVAQDRHIRLNNQHITKMENAELAKRVVKMKRAPKVKNPNPTGLGTRKPSAPRGTKSVAGVKMTSGLHSNRGSSTRSIGN